MNVYDYFFAKLPFCSDDDTLKNCPLDSEVGRACKVLIDAAEVICNGVRETGGPDSVDFYDVVCVVDRACQIYWRG